MKEERIVKASKIAVISLTVLLVSSMFFYSPRDIGPAGIMIWFFGLLLLLSVVFTWVGYIYKSYRHINNTNLTSSFRQGFLSSIIVVSILGLNSLQQLSVKDIVLVIALVSLIEFYFRKAFSKVQK